MDERMNVREASKLFAMRLKGRKILDADRAFALPTLADPLEVCRELLSGSLTTELPFSLRRKIAVMPASAIFPLEVGHVHVEMHIMAEREREEPRSRPCRKLRPCPLTPFCAAHSATLRALSTWNAGKMQREGTRINPHTLLRVIVAASVKRPRARTVTMGTQIPFPDR